MKAIPSRTAAGVLGVVLAAIFAFAPVSGAQTTPSQPATTPAATPAQQSTTPAAQSDSTSPTLGTGLTTGKEAPKIDPAEEAAYKAFSDIKTDDTDKQIQAGEQFVEKYPASRYDLQVYTALTQDYLNKQLTDKMYASADKALALDPDDVSILVLVGWAIPHHYDSKDLEADRKLDKAEAYEKHALDLLATMPKPANLTDEQFGKVKTQAESQAHSALGLVYFRRQDYEKSITELQQGTSTAPSADPTDYFVMGMELKKLTKYKDAADAFQKCAGLGGQLASRCKDSADESKKLAASAPATPPSPKP
jgi:tetratricopeptide (TPR) repeat protein